MVWKKQVVEITNENGEANQGNSSQTFHKSVQGGIPISISTHSGACWKTSPLYLNLKTMLKFVNPSQKQKFR
jgi:hypothetical protein